MRLLAPIILPALFAAFTLAAESGATEPPLAASPKEAALEHLLSERSSPEAFAVAVKEARERGISEQAILEARFIFHIDREEDGAIAAMLPDFLERDKNFKLGESEIFATKEDWLAVVQYVQAIVALRSGDKASFKKHITEAFWLSPKQGSAFGTHIERLRLDETMATVKLDFTSSFTPLSGGEAVPLSSVLGKSKAIIIQFWSPMSGECEATLPDFVTIAAELEKNGIAVASVVLEDSGRGLADTRAMLAPLGEKPPGTWLVDRERDPLSALLRVQSVPVFALISTDGKVLFNGPSSSDGLWSALRSVSPSIQRPSLSHSQE